MRRHFIKASVASVASYVLGAQAQTYPDRVVKLVLPFPGGPTDVFARVVAHALQAGWGQPTIVDPKPGAGGIVAASSVAKATPDGYTLLATSSSTHVVAPAMRRELPYDVEKDFIPIMSTGSVPFLIVIHPSVPAKNLRELIAYAKANPNTLAYGSSGHGAGQHLGAEILAHFAGIQLQHVPYKSAGQAMADLLGGQIQILVDAPNNSTPHLSSGKIRGLAVMGSERVALLPDLPTTAELGYPGIKMYTWAGIYAPANVPRSVVARVTEILKVATAGPKFRDYFDTAAMPQKPLFGADFVRESKAQRDELIAFVKAAGIPLVE